MAQLVAATVFHTGQLDLPTSASRQLLGPGVILGRSTHTLEQARIAERDPNVGYFCVGPVWPTPTKEGRPGIGVNAVQAVAQTHPAKPWFAIGGINETSLELVLQAGAQRVVVVRAITEAADPFQASRRLKTRLSSAVSTRQ
jgi:thiamine-phosphate pyrophosphorylase